MSSSDPPTRTSLMNIPVEIRLQIYEYLFSPCASDGLPCARLVDHNCSWPSGFEREPDSTRPRCTCILSKQHLYPNVLRTNHQIFNEAREILYKNVELCVSLPGRHTRKLSPLEETIQVLPSYALPEIRRILIVGCEEQATVRHCCSDFVWRDAVEEYTALITSQLPNLTHLRLYVEARHPKIGLAAATAAASFATVARIPSLQNVVIEADRANGWTDNLLQLIKDALEIARESARQSEHRSLQLES